MFKREYLKNTPASFQWQTTPLQIYDLGFLKTQIKFPLPMLCADYNFLFYIREGSIAQQIGTEKYRIEANSLVFISTGTVSALEKISNDVKGYFLLIEDEAMSVLFNQEELLNVFMIDPVLKLKIVESEWIYSISKLIFAELGAQWPNMHIGNSLVQALLNKILHLSEKDKSLSRTEQIAIQFKQLVHKNFTDQKRISFYAKTLAVSENYLNRCVKTVFNKSCKEIIIEIALLNSKILLANISKSISEISYELNFEDPSYFARLFKKFAGCTPSEYRMKLMHDLS